MSRRVECAGAALPPPNTPTRRTRSLPTHRVINRVCPRVTGRNTPHTILPGRSLPPPIPRPGWPCPFRCSYGCRSHAPRRVRLEHKNGNSSNHMGSNNGSNHSIRYQLFRSIRCRRRTQTWQKLEPQGVIQLIQPYRSITTEPMYPMDAPNTNTAIARTTGGHTHDPTIVFDSK